MSIIMTAASIIAVLILVVGLFAVRKRRDYVSIVVVVCLALVGLDQVLG